MRLDPTATYRASPDVTCCPLGDGLALFDLRSNSYFSLNRSGALLWQQTASDVSLADLKAALAQAYAKPEHVIAGDVERTVAALIDAQLLVPSESKPSPSVETEINVAPGRA